MMSLAWVMGAPWSVAVVVGVPVLCFILAWGVAVWVEFAAESNMNIFLPSGELSSTQMLVSMSVSRFFSSSMRAWVPCGSFSLRFAAFARAVGRVCGWPRLKPVLSM